MTDKGPPIPSHQLKFTARAKTKESTTSVAEGTVVEFTNRIDMHQHGSYNNGQIISHNNLHLHMNNFNCFHGSASKLR